MAINSRPSRQLRLETLEGRLTPALATSAALAGPVLEAQATRDVVFVDEYLLDQVPQQELAGRDVVTVSASSDAISQISAALATRTNVGVVRLISHGEAGAILLGDQVIDQRVLSARSQEIASWGANLAPGADFLIYGCSVASTEDGIAFTDYLATLTGADVAASTGLTGANGGDTTLEYATGQVTHGLGATLAAWQDAGLQLLDTSYVYPTQRLGTGSALTAGSGQQFTNLTAFAVLNRNGTVTAWGEAAAGGATTGTTGVPASLQSAPDLNTVRPQQLFSNERAFAALMSDGSLRVWGDANYGVSNVPAAVTAANLSNPIIAVYSTKGGFAALRQDNTIDWWYGSSGLGITAQSGTQPAPSASRSVKSVFTTQAAFCALLSDNSLSTPWGEASYGGQVNAGRTLPTNVTMVVSNQKAFAALGTLSGNTGSYTTWGDAAFGGDESFTNTTNQPVYLIGATEQAFAFVQSSAGPSIVTSKGNPEWGATQYIAQTSQIIDIVATSRAFCVVYSDGTVGAFGPATVTVTGNYGGDGAPTSTTLGATKVVSTGGAFAAFNASNNLVAVWGNAAWGNPASIPTVTGTSRVASTQTAFAALNTSTGRVTAWGNDGGTAPASVTAAGSNVVQLFSNGFAFTALKGDGTVVSWGVAGNGGTTPASGVNRAVALATPFTDNPWFANDESVGYEKNIGSKTFNLVPKAFPGTISVTKAAGGDVYPSGVTVSSAGVMSVDTNQTPTGVYTFYFNAANSSTNLGAYGNTTDYAFTLTIGQAPAFSTPTATTNFTVLATNNAYTAPMTQAGFPAPTYFLSGAPAWVSINTSTGAVTGTPPSGTVQTSPFTFTITATNFVRSDSQTLTLSVIKATPDPSWTAPSAITYGTALSVVQLNATASVSNSSVAYPITPTYTKTVPTPVASIANGTLLNAGSYTLQASFAANNDYNAATVDVPFTVNKAALTITAQPNTKTYDKTVTAAAVPTVSGLQTGPTGADTVTNLAEVYDNSNAGTGKTLSVSSYTVNDGNGGNNYTVTTVNSTAGVITQAPLTITAQTNTKVYDANTSAAAVPVTTGLVTGDTISNVTEVYDNPNVGTGKTLRVDTYTINDGNNGNNYAVTTVDDTTGVITKAALTIAAQPNTKVYDANTSAAAQPSVSGLQGGDTVTGMAETYDNPNVGIGKILTVTAYTVNDGNNGGNYDVALVPSINGVITAAPLTITAQTNTKTYDGTTSAAAIPVVSGLQGSDTVSNLAEIYDTSTSGTGKTLSVSSYTVNDGNSGNNYSVTTVTDTTGVINKANQDITWPNPASIIYGTPLSSLQLNATVTGVSGGTAPGNLSYVPDFGDVLDAGDQGLTVTAAETVNYNPADAAVPLTVLKATPLPTVQTSPNPSIYGGVVTVTASVPPVGSGAVPIGTVIFLNGSTEIGRGSLDGSGFASLNYSQLLAGNYNLSAQFLSQDPNYNDATSPVVVQTVNKAGSSTSVVATPNPSVFGTSITFTATVTGVSGALLPTGDVQFVDSTTSALLGTGTLANGVATFNISSMVAGSSYSIVASYLGDTNYNGSDSAQYPLTIAQANTTTTVTTQAPAPFGTSITISAAVAGVQGALIPTGTVTFVSGATILGISNLNGQGVASFPVSTLPVGVNTITATYNGDPNYNTSTGNANQVINKANTTTTVVSSLNPSLLNNSVTFTATVVQASGTPSPSDLVQFSYGSTVLGTSTLSGGVASLTTTLMPPGISSVVATFPGDANYNGSNGSVSQTVNWAPTITSANATTFIVGTSGTFSVTSTGYPDRTYAISGALPTGVTFNTSTGVLSGNAAALTGGTYPLVITASNGINPVATQNFTLTVNEAPAITSANTVTFTETIAGSFTVTSTGFPARSYAITQGALPSGMALNGTTGVISGTPTDGSLGTYPVTISASNGVGTPATQALTINVWRNVPAATGSNLTTPFDLGPGSYVVSLGNGKVLINNPSGQQQQFTPFPGFTGTLSTSLVDRNGDGTADSIMVAVATGGAPAVLVLDAGTGNVAYNFYAFDPGFRGGVTVAGGVTKIDGKATTVVLGGAGPGAEPSISAFDAVTGTFRKAFYAYAQAYRGGVRVAMSGPDSTGQSLVVASPAINSHVTTFTLEDPSRALASFYAFDPVTLYRGVWVAAGHLNGDGLSELVVGAGPGTNGKAEISVFDLQGNLKKNFLAFAQGFTGGVSVAVSDYNKDGVGDIFASSGAGAKATFNVFNYADLSLIDAVFLPTDSLLGTFVANDPSAGSQPFNPGGQPG